jgi:hypothetical protein
MEIYIHQTLVMVEIIHKVIDALHTCITNAYPNNVDRGIRKLDRIRFGLICYSIHLISIGLSLLSNSHFNYQI